MNAKFQGMVLMQFQFKWKLIVQLLFAKAQPQQGVQNGGS